MYNTKVVIHWYHSYRLSCEKVLRLNNFMTFLSLVGYFAQTNQTQYGSQTKCWTQGCRRTAENMKNYLDESINPCENFYGFACGNYIKNTIIPRGQGSINVFTSVEDLVSEQLRPIISEPTRFNESKTIRLTKYFYASCVNQDEHTDDHVIKQMADILEELGGWPVVRGDTWQDRSFHWIETVKQFRRFGLNTNAIFSLNIETDSQNSSRRLLIVSEGTHGSIVLVHKQNLFVLFTDWSNAAWHWAWISDTRNRR